MATKSLPVKKWGIFPPPCPLDTTEHTVPSYLEGRVGWDGEYPLFSAPPKPCLHATSSGLRMENSSHHHSPDTSSKRGGRRYLQFLAPEKPFLQAASAWLWMGNSLQITLQRWCHYSLSCSKTRGRKIPHSQSRRSHVQMQLWRGWD